MKNKIIVLISAIFTALFLSGCIDVAAYEKEYVAMSLHPGIEQDLIDTMETVIVGEASNYDEMLNVFFDMVRNYTKFGIVKIIDYDGDATYDATEACVEMAYGTSLGMFAIRNMNANIVQYEDYTGAEVTINYSKSASQIKNIQDAQNYNEIGDIIYDCLRLASTYTVFYTELSGIDPAYITELAESYYYGDATLMVYPPVTTTAVYSGFDDGSVIEINFARQYSRNTLMNMRYEMLGKAKTYISGYTKEKTGAWMLETCQKLSDEIEYIKFTDEQNSANASAYTAYGAFTEGKATSEGFAMAFKALCDLNDIECFVVIGERNSEKHCWNIVNFEENYYHIDVARIEEAGLENMFLKNDETMKGMEYSWNGEYPVCRQNTSEE